MFGTIPASGFSQNIWTLDSCLHYAVENNISVKLSELERRLSQIQLDFSKARRNPTLRFNTTVGTQIGRSIDPTTNNYTTTQLFSQSMVVQLNIDLFNWFSLDNTIKADLNNQEAGYQDTKKSVNDVELNITAAYFQLILALQQKRITINQIEMDIKQMKIVERLVHAGRSPKINILQLQSALGKDSLTYFDNCSTVFKSKLRLMLLLNLPAGKDLQVDTTGIIATEAILLENKPEEIYEIALANQPLQLGNISRIKSLGYKLKAIKSSKYPTISANANIASNYANLFSDRYREKAPYERQLLNTNLNQFIGLTLSIPILSNKQFVTSYRRTEAELLSAKLKSTNSNNDLLQIVYSAYNDALISFKKYNLSIKNEKIAEQEFLMAQRRFSIGDTRYLEYRYALTNWVEAKEKKTASLYDYLFKEKILSVYLRKNQ